MHKLAPGVRLSEGAATDRGGRGMVKMHALRVDLARSTLSIRPLVRSIAQRTPLTELARGHKNVVAAVNTGYFDFATGAPTQPLVVAGRLLVASARRQRVIGVDANNRLQAGRVGLSATVSVGQTTQRLTGINTVGPSRLAVYDPSWGTTPIPTGPSSVVRPVIHRRLGEVSARNVPATVPNNGYELVAGPRAASWLSQQPAGTPVHLTTHLRVSSRRKAKAPRAFEQAFGVGTKVVSGGVARTGLACNSAGTVQPARTAIGIAEHGTVLVIGEVEDHPGTKVHGLDEDQMGMFMKQLGADRAWNLDGSGSTELLARMPHQRSLSLRTYPADGKERRMPVGLGIFYAPKHDHRHSK
ncbi:MAG TPA: phosphodiester glycosidase family protein [Mycobacteriales bacterium]|nr:phosphodiester glycosidase family protein [Mycobacteriales bacterium]